MMVQVTQGQSSSSARLELCQSVPICPDLSQTETDSRHFPRLTCPEVGAALPSGLSLGESLDASLPSGLQLDDPGRGTVSTLSLVLGHWRGCVLPALIGVRSVTQSSTWSASQHPGRPRSPSVPLFTAAQSTTGRLFVVPKTTAVAVGRFR